MSFLHIAGFGEKLELNLRYRWKWYPKFPDDALELEPGDMIVLNLINNFDINAVNKVIEIVDFIAKNKGILLVISAPFKSISKRVSNYHFLPWRDKTVSRIESYDEFHIRSDSGSPNWVESLIFRFRDKLVAPASFQRLPAGVHKLMHGSSGQTISFSYKNQEGRILVLPSIKPIIHGEVHTTAKKILRDYLEFIGSQILTKFGEVTQPPPEWLNDILIRDEKELRKQYHSLNDKLIQLDEEKSILSDDGPSLTRKIASLLNRLGFQTDEMEIRGHQDIEISEGEIKAFVECSGSIRNFRITKLRQLIDYLLNDNETKPKGIFIGNPWKNIHPKDRDLTSAFTENVVKRATQLEICLVTVPHLYRVLLETKSDNEKKRVRESLLQCVGLWEYPSSEWE